MKKIIILAAMVGLGLILGAYLVAQYQPAGQGVIDRGVTKMSTYNPG